MVRYSRLWLEASLKIKDGVHKMSKIKMYAKKLRELDDWDTYLLQESGLPGPRSNLELLQAVAEEGNEELFLRYIAIKAEDAPVNSREEFLAACGTVGLGRLIAGGKIEYLPALRILASDSRWRIREGVAMALQIYGASHMEQLLHEMEEWRKGNNFEKRAAAAAICEPGLLQQREQAIRALKILNSITSSIQTIGNRKEESFKALRKGLAYCWSVAIVAQPDEGKILFAEWFTSKDQDIIWIIKENLKKDRLQRMDAEWVKESKSRLGML